MTTKEKCEFIYNKSNDYVDGRTCSGNNLVDILNSENITTLKGTAYKHGRGIYTLINAAYHYIEKTKGEVAAGRIATAFVNAKGEGAWWHKDVKNKNTTK